MKAALVGPTYPYRGGIAHYTTLLYHELVARGHQVGLYSFKRQYPAWLFPGQSDRDPSEHRLEAACEYTLDSLNPFTWRATARAIQTQRPDVLILQWWVPFFAPLWIYLARTARRSGTRVIFICHNVLPHEQRPWDAWVARQTLGCGDGFVVQAQEEKARLAALLPERPVKTVPHPVNDKLADRSISRAAARQQLGLPQAAPVLLFFGFVREYKGLRHLLDAMPNLQVALPGVRLLIVGEFWQDKRPYLDQIERLGIGPSVIVVDRYVPNEQVAVYFSAADVLVLPYVHATQSAVAPVAFGLGLPVITTRVGGLPEFVADGETGLLVPPGDAGALAEAVERYFKDNLGPTMRRAIQAANKFTWSELARAIEELV